jgi:Spy/CpxP family protein refolding chaperone
MKKLHLAMAASALFALAVMPVHAQDATTTTSTKTTATAKKGKAGGAHKTSGRADAELADLSKSLNLTDDQKAKIKPIIDDKEAQIHSAKMAKTGTDEEKKAKTKAIRDDAKTKIRAELTPDQQKIYDGESHKHKKSDAPAA